jgi:chromosome segregation ATPase
MSMEKEAYKAFAEIPKEFHERGNDCMYQLQEAAKAFDEFAGQVAQEVTQRSEQRREEAVRAIRKQQDLIDEIQKELWPAEDRSNAAYQDLSAAHLQLRAALESKPTLYPLKEEIAAWEEAVQMARATVEQAEQDTRVASQAPLGVLSRLRAAKAQLQDLMDKEFALRPQKEQKDLISRGMAPVNSQLGLMGVGTTPGL